ncbi:MAG: cation:proton antiporter [Bdellovibrionales bacterium]
MLEVICISLALGLGLLARFVGLPPLVGFLCGGFLINFISPYIDLGESFTSTMNHLAHLGVLMLLFTVGLKLKFKQVVKSEVIGGSLLHFALVVGLFLPVVHFVFQIELRTALIVAISLGFSSTVLAAKLLETKRELSVFHGRTTIGILIIQDIIALAVLAVFSGKIPNYGALILLGLPLIRIALHKIVDIAGHGELMVLVAMLLSIVVGGAGFTAMGLSSELGALIVGALVSNHPKAGEISANLLSMKELFLVCFFLSIGLSGLPTLESFQFAALFSLLLPLKAAFFFGILVLFKLRARTAFLSALSLMSFSEFGLIVAAALIPEYMVTLALTMAFSYVISAPVNRYAHNLFEKWEAKIVNYELDSVHPDEQPKDLKDANVLIFGVGRTGSAAYLHMQSLGFKPVGLDADQYKIERLEKKGMNVLFADAEDSQFWHSVSLNKIKAVILALDDIEAKLISIRMLKEKSFSGPIVSNSLYEDHQARIVEAGATHTYLTMTRAGRGLAEYTMDAIQGAGSFEEQLEREKKPA